MHDAPPHSLAPSAALVTPPDGAPAINAIAPLLDAPAVDAEARVRASAARALEAVARARALAEHAEQHFLRAHHALGERDALLADARAARAALCDAVEALAAGLRRAGARPERMLVLVKAAVRGGTAPGSDPAAAQELVGDAVRCGIGAYYAAAA